MGGFKASPLFSPRAGRTNEVNTVKVKAIAITTIAEIYLLIAVKRRILPSLTGRAFVFHSGLPPVHTLVVANIPLIHANHI